MNHNQKQLFGSIVRALRHRNFRLFFSGQSISLIGTWMQRVAVAWLVYRLTGSAFMLGLVGFAGRIPLFVLAPFAGVLADRWNRHRILLVTQICAMVQAFAFSFLVLSHMVRIWQIIVLAVVLGIINAFDVPTRQSFVIEMVEDKKELGNAIALNSSMFNLARLIGPSIAGMLIAAFGEGVCFFLNGLSFMAVVVSLLMMRLAKKETVPSRSNARHALVEGFRYAAGFAPIRAILLMLALISLMGMPYIVLMPVFARDVLNGGPGTLGFLMGCAGLGALAGALYLAARKSVLGLGKMIPIAAGLLGGGLVAFSFSRSVYVSMALMVVAGFGQIVHMATGNTLLQILVDDDKRGRIMSLYAMAFGGMMPLGSLLAGAVAGWIGAPWTVFAGGSVCLIGAVVFARMLPTLRAMAHPVYVRMGIVPEIAEGLASTAESPPAVSRIR
jgi:MFS family permease